MISFPRAHAIESDIDRVCMYSFKQIVEEPIERIISFIDQTIDHFADEVCMHDSFCVVYIARTLDI